MKLLKITDNLLINPEMISQVELRKVKGKPTIVVTVDGKQHIADIEPTEMMQGLIGAGMSSDSKMWQFWAG